MPSPMPLVEPVTSDTLPFSEGEADGFPSVMAMFMACELLGWLVASVEGRTPGFFSVDHALGMRQTGNARWLRLP
jgi:hypothetical protein